MVGELILETTFLIDLQREQLRGRTGPAQEFLEAIPQARLVLTYTVAGEMAAGVSLSARKAWELFLAPFRILPCTPDVCWEFGKAYRHLQAQGLLIGTNDLWIGATALAHALPVVTANVGHFNRIPGLEVVPYRPV